MGTRATRPASLALAFILGAALVAPASAVANPGAPQAGDAGFVDAPSATRSAARDAITSGPAVAPTDVAAASTTSGARVYYGEELMRLTNLDRRALGRRALAADPLLISLARDLTIPCPARPSLMLHGRSRDMADRSYFSHQIKGCTRANGSALGYTDLLRKLGYHGWTVIGENIAYNNYPTGTSTYRTGCPSGTTTGCRGSTLTARQVAVSQRLFMNSAGHRANLLRSSFDRFGCGAWHRAGTAMAYFTCIFAKGGSVALDKTGPAFSAATGTGTTIPVGGSLAFTIRATDSADAIAEAWVAIDGRTVASWAYDSATTAVDLAVTISQSGLATGPHVLTWHARDAGTNERQAMIGFFSGSGSAAPPTAGFSRPATGTTGFSTASPTIAWTESLAASPPSRRAIVASWAPQVTTGVCGTSWSDLPAVYPSGTAWTPSLVARRCYRFALSVDDAFGGHVAATSGTLMVAGTPGVIPTTPAAGTSRSAPAGSRFQVAWRVAANGAPITRQVLRMYWAVRPAAGCTSVRTWKLLRSVPMAPDATSGYVRLGGLARCYRFRNDVTNAANLTRTAYGGVVSTR